MQISSSKRWLVLLVSIIVVCFFTGCDGEQENKVATPLKINNGNTNEAESLLEELEPVTSAIAIKQDKDLFAAAEVEHMARFRLEEIRKQAHSLLKHRWPDATVRFSTDEKAVLELRKLKTEIDEKDIKEKERKKRLNKIEELMKG